MEKKQNQQSECLLVGELNKHFLSTTFHFSTSTRQKELLTSIVYTGYYLRLHPSTLETLTRSGVEASASRARKSEIVDPIREEDGHANINEPGQYSVYRF